MQQSRSFGFPPQHANVARVGGPGFAEIWSKHFAVGVARLRTVRRGGEMDRRSVMYVSGYIHSANALDDPSGGPAPGPSFLGHIGTLIAAAALSQK